LLHQLQAELNPGADLVLRRHGFCRVVLG